MENLIPTRDKIKEEISTETFDIIIIGGGITGAGVARDASLRGLKVVLFEKGDFASGSSSQTSKLIHGGLRYLRNYEFRLVRQAALERKVHIEIAPHLAEITEFVIPQYKWNTDRKIMLRLGLWLYDLLAIPKRIGKHKFMTVKDVMEALPFISPEGLKYGASFHDVKTDDARLTLANILSASAAGAKTLNYSEVKTWEDTDDKIVTHIEDRITGETYSVSGLSLIICGGPFSDIIENRGIWFDGSTQLKLTRGTHLILKKRLNEKACLLINEDKRPIFLIPQLDYDLIGTTDVEYDGVPDDVTPTLEDQEYLLNAINKLFPQANYSEEDIVASYAGVRPLIFQNASSEGKISREHTINVYEGGIITIAGGKLTTYRKMSEQAINKILKILKLRKSSHRCMTHKLPLWGGEIDSWDDYRKERADYLRKTYKITEETADMLVKWYGSEIDFFETYIKKYGTEILLEGRPWLRAQVNYSCQVEMTQSPIDFLRRRTPIMLEEGNGMDILNDVCQIMMTELNWTNEIKDSWNEKTKKYIAKFISSSNN